MTRIKTSLLSSGVYSLRKFRVKKKKEKKSETHEKR